MEVAWQTTNFLAHEGEFHFPKADAIFTKLTHLSYSEHIWSFFNCFAISFQTTNFLLDNQKVRPGHTWDNQEIIFKTLICKKLLSDTNTAIQVSLLNNLSNKHISWGLKLMKLWKCFYSAFLSDY